MDKTLTDVDRWTIEDLLDSLKPQPIKDRKIILPSFQRGIVWSPEKKKALITSIKEGMPIGSLLLYKENQREKWDIYALVDGLQRATSIKKYAENPNAFFQENHLDKQLVTNVCNIINKNAEEDDTNIRKMIADWVRSRKDFSEVNGWSSASLAHHIGKAFSLESNQINELTFTVFPTFLEKIEKESYINEVQIPVMIYKGQKSNLPTIFHNLNRLGTQLNRFQIYAATWTTYPEFDIKNKKIVDKIKEKYDAAIDEGLEIEDYDPNTFTNGKFNYFEYFFGLGKYLSKYPLLFGKTLQADEPDSIGFNLGTICIGHDLKQMVTLPDEFIEEIDINDYEKCLMEAIEETDKILQPFIGLKANRTSKDEIKPCHTQHQIISIIGKVFQSMFDENLEPKPNRRAKLEKLTKNVPYHYLYDVLRDYWSGSGDSKALELIKSERYEEPLSKKDWDGVLDAWYKDEKQKKEMKRKNVSAEAVLFFKYIYCHIYSWHDEQATVFEVEHICPIDRLKVVAEQIDGLPMSAVANLCLIEKKLNRKKGTKTFYEYYKEKIRALKRKAKKRRIARESMLELKKELAEVEKRTYVNEEDLDFLKKLSTDNYGAYLNYLDNRFQVLKDEFYKRNSIN